MSLQVRTRVAAVTCAVVLSHFGCVGFDEDAAELDESFSGNGFDPIVFVAPCPPPGTDYPTIAGVYGPFIDFLRTQGYPESYLNNWVPSTGSPVCYSTFTLAAALDPFVDQVLAATGKSKVDIVAASGGALTGRLWLNDASNHDKVQDFVSVNGVNHGSVFTEIGGELQIALGAPNYEQMKELFPPYACEGETFFGQSQDLQLAVNGCLTASGRTVARDETPGSANYLAIRNTLDEQVIPGEAACLDQGFQNDCSGSVNVAVSVPPGTCDFPPMGNVCPAHVRTIFVPETWQLIYDFLN